MALNTPATSSDPTGPRRRPGPVYATPVNTRHELWCVRESTVQGARACVQVEESNFKHLFQNRELDTS